MAQRRAPGQKKTAEPAGDKTANLAPAQFPKDIQKRFETYEWRHASAILKSDFPEEWADQIAMLRDFKLRKSWVTTGGGNKSQIAKWIDQFLGARNWVEKDFDTAIIVDKAENKSPTHSVDCFKNRIAFEVEWNNKDPFFDRDLNNFRLLFDLRTVSVGIIFTRCDELQDIFDALERGSSYGQSTTHMSKLLPKIAGGGGGGCPIIAIGIRKNTYAENE